MEKLVHRWDQERKLRLEKNGYLSDYSVDPASDKESASDKEAASDKESSSDKEECNEYEEEYEENAEMLSYDSKWFTS